MKRYSIIDGKTVENELGVFVRYSDMEYITDLRDEKIERLESQLAAEQLRRERAEKVVDFIIRRPLVYDKTSAWDICIEHRKLYPKDSKDMNNG